MKKDINFEQLKQWFIIYNKYKQPKRKKQILTLIIMSCKPYIKTLSYGLARRANDPVEDIIQVANVGLIKAVKKYKPEYNNLKSYISYAIVGEIKHYLRDKSSLIKPPREIIELSYRINQLTIKEIEKAGEKYNQEILAKDLNTSTEKIREVFEVDRRRTISLDQIKFENDISQKNVENYISDEKNEKIFKLHEKKALLIDALEKLPQKSRLIIEKIYFENVSQVDLAKELSTSQSNISRIQKRALKMLFKIITENKDEK